MMPESLESDAEAVEQCRVKSQWQVRDLAESGAFSRNWVPAGADLRVSPASFQCGVQVA